MLRDKLKALASWPELLHNEAHAIADRLDTLAQLITRALNRQPEPAPEFVLVLWQAMSLDSGDQPPRPMIGAMSGRMHNRKTLRLEAQMHHPIQNLTVMVFANLEAVRIEGILCGSRILQMAAASGSGGAPLAYHPDVVAAGTKICVELGAR